MQSILESLERTMAPGGAAGRTKLPSLARISTSPRRFGRQSTSGRRCGAGVTPTRGTRMARSDMVLGAFASASCFLRIVSSSRGFIGTIPSDFIALRRAWVRARFCCE